MLASWRVLRRVGCEGGVLSDDGGDRRRYSSSSFYLFLLLTTGTCQRLAVVTSVALVNGSLLRQRGCYHVHCPPTPAAPLDPHWMFDVFAILHRPVYQMQ